MWPSLWGYPYPSVTGPYRPDGLPAFLTFNLVSEQGVLMAKGKDLAFEGSPLSTCLSTEKVLIFQGGVLLIGMCVSLYADRRRGGNQFLSHILQILPF